MKKNNRYLANSFLFLTFITYVIAIYFKNQYNWLGYVIAFAEAGMIGGIADWFAVTALGGSSFDSDERMTKLVDIYQQVTQNTFVMKGFATKVTFGAEFLECIYDAISKTDMAISVDFEGDQGFSRGRRGSGRRYGIRNDMARNDRGTHDNRSRGDRYVQTGYRRGSRR